MLLPVGRSSWQMILPSGAGAPFTLDTLTFSRFGSCTTGVMRAQAQSAVTHSAARSFDMGIPSPSRPSYPPGEQSSEGFAGGSEVPDDGVAKLRALHLFHALLALRRHQAREVVGDRLRGDGAVHALDDQVGDLVPAQVPEHHLAGEDDRARVHLVLVGVLGRGAVGGLEDGVPADVVDVAAG